MNSASLVNARASKNELDVIRYRLKNGDITYDEAKLTAGQPLKILNAYMKQRAKDFGVKHHLINFAGFMR